MRDCRLYSPPADEDGLAKAAEESWYRPECGSDGADDGFIVYGVAAQTVQSKQERREM